MKSAIRVGAGVALAMLLLAGCSRDNTTTTESATDTAEVTPMVVADVIYSGGKIITINDAMPVAEAVAVAGGHIIAVGSEADVSPYRSNTTRQIDLDGKTMVPGFVDAHGHAYAVGLQASVTNLLPPPDGDGRDIESVVQLMLDWKASHEAAIERVGWIAGFGYDDSQLEEQRHPTRDDLDRVSEEIPVIIVHQSGHLGVANSKALELAGITSETEDPQGGVFRRREGSNEPNGVAEEYAFFALLSRLAARFDDEINETLVMEGARLYASFGYTTAQEGRGTKPALQAMQRLSAKGVLPIDLVIYPDVLAFETDEIRPTAEYSGHFRVAGVKLTIDGSPQGKTAWLSQPYFVPPAGQDKDYAGYAAIDEATTYAGVEKAFAQGWQVLVHANGDAAMDRYIEAVRRARAKYPDVKNRPVLIHGQTLRKDQVPQLKALGIFPSLFPMHTFYWGDWHRESVLGPERAENISPTGWVLAEGMQFSTHHDAPVALPDSMRVLSATVTRTTRSGRVLGPEHRVSVMTALKAMTLWPAWQHFEERTKGSIEVGKLADLVILSDDPLTIEQDQLASIQVLETIKQGKTVYQREPEAAGISTPAPFGLLLEEPRAGEHDHMHGDGCFNTGLQVLYRAFNQRSSSDQVQGRATEY